MHEPHFVMNMEDLRHLNHGICLYSYAQSMRGNEG